MKIFLTGASGFVGSFLLRELLDNKSHQICVLLRNPDEAWRIADVLRHVTLIRGGLDSLDSFENQLEKFSPDVVAHLAWGGVQNQDRNSTAQWRNISKTLELIEIAQRAGATAFIGLGSQAEYGPCQEKVDERFSTRPTTLYGHSKLAACNLGQALCEVLGLRFAWLRLFSSYGPSDHPSWMIPYLIKSLLKSERPKLTAAEQRWDYIYVRDVASAIKSVIETPLAQGVFNLGSGQAHPLREVIEKIRDLIDPSLSLGFGDIPYRPDQVMHLEADISALNKATGWLPHQTLGQGLLETVNWYRKDRAVNT